VERDVNSSRQIGRIGAKVARYLDEFSRFENRKFETPAVNGTRQKTTFFTVHNAYVVFVTLHKMCIKIRPVICISLCSGFSFFWFVKTGAPFAKLLVFDNMLQYTQRTRLSIVGQSKHIVQL